MPESPETAIKVRNRRVHMANERTFLAWIRTSIGVMAFGFVVEKFGLFVKQMSYFLKRYEIPGSQKPPTDMVSPSSGYSAIFGILLVGVGVLMALLAYIRYKKVEKQIDEDTYRPSIILDALLALTIFVVGLFLILYLVHSM